MCKKEVAMIDTYHKDGIEIRVKRFTNLSIYQLNQFTNKKRCTMKKLLTMGMMIAIASSTAVGTAWAKQGALDTAEKDSLVLMREEEKLARDVYLTFAQKWDNKVFYNISQAEQRHMDKIGQLLEKYQVADPIQNDSIGEFSNPKMRELYQQLVVEGNKDLLSALTVGAKIEDLDIADLMKDSKLIDEKDILQVYDNLTRGSRNHLRAFNRNINKMGGQYQNTYISSELFNQIIHSDKEHGKHGQCKHSQ